MDGWDYIVVGAGSAGAALAARLSEDSCRRVLLLEAGGADDGLRFDMVAMSSLKLRGNPETDWMYVAEPDPTREGRREPQTRGRVLGGSSSINGTVYVRGNRGDYDHWAQLGNTGWDYDSMLKVFHRMERGVGALAGSATYGTDGPIHISDARGLHPLTKNFMAALNELGVPSHDYNEEAQFGTAICRVNQDRGRRWGTSRGYLRPARGRANFAIMDGVLARRVVIEGNRAVGVEYERGGEVSIARCRGEVILSAGVFNSPKLLMLSGIGDGAHLAAHGIAVTHANSNVGLNLHDHPGIAVRARVRSRTVNMDNTRLGRLKLGLEYMLFGAGAATHHWPALGFVKIDPNSEYPDMQIHFGPFILEVGSSGVVFPNWPGIMMIHAVQRPWSRGHVRLRSANPSDAPKIQTNMLADRRDVERLIAGVRFGRRVLNSKAFAPEFVEEIGPGAHVVDDAAMEDFVRKNAASAYHPSGTVKMGVDEAAVVDPRLRVHGVVGLRVADSAIIPSVPSGNTNAISIAIGEKAAQMIREDALA